MTDPRTREREALEMALGSCWIWTRAKTNLGYGSIYRNGVSRRVHVETWEAIHGPVPTGKVLHHLCYARDCYKPAHLQLLDRAQHHALHNKQRGQSMTTCKRGHLFDAGNTIQRSNGQRGCRACKRLSDRRYMQMNTDRHAAIRRASQNRAYWKNPEQARAKKRAQYCKAAAIEALEDSRG